ncbi:F-box domain containing protein [Colletotrichum kahawae]|uniref:F-box domain containing protein n=1 Tax=Colletotrichum kahawae TaxID=34407 RepID=A0AAD9XW52_COLKA|nr:F-box domain containing protein [Colletotrichum kahawae]
MSLPWFESCSSTSHCLKTFDVSAEDERSTLPERDSDLEKSSAHVDMVQNGTDSPGQPKSGVRGASAKMNKRKSVHSSFDIGDHQGGQANFKKPRLGSGEKALRQKGYVLPSAVWQHVFTLLHPKDLGNLLQTSRLFNMCLDPGSSISEQQIHETVTGCCKPIKPDTIWQSSRRLFCPRMPAPLQDKTELDMWRLCCSVVCERCATGKENRKQDKITSCRQGPGVDGLATVFAFGTVCCGQCLLKDSVKEIDLLLSSITPSSLIPALPFVFVTNELHVVSPSTLSVESNEEMPQTTKIFWAPHVETAKAELQQARNLGAAAVEEWLKGLAARGKDARLDASRWEKWALAGGLFHMRQSASSASTIIAEDQRCEIPVAQDKLEGTMPPDTSSRLSMLANAPPTDFQGRQERAREEAAARKALRRIEIERRAMLIDPPLPPNVLVHIPSFQAAIQITAMLDDDAWCLLQPRLLAQRADAEREENKKKLANVQRPLFEATEPAPKEASDKDWDDIQGPVRASIAKHADETIRNNWAKGRKVNRENSPRFAADVLVSVRTRFYSDVAKDAADAIANGQQPPVDPPQGPFTQKLTLENMKWVFDMKIKAHTDSHRKEMFLCNGCDSNRYYGFEGVIQHYAAKHTKALSLGNVVVHWRAEWPQESPFRTNPRTSKKPRHNPSHGPQQQGASGPSSHHQGHDAFFANGGNPPSIQYPFSAGPVAQVGPPPQHAVPYGPSPSYHGVGVLDTGIYCPPAFVAGLSGSHPPAPSGHGLFDHGPLPEFPPNMMAPPCLATNQYSAADFYSGARSQYHAPQSNLYQPTYHAQLENLVRNARGIWNTLSSIKDMPGPLKVCVAFYHVVKRFRLAFSETPSLRMFNDGLSNHKDMRPVRNVNGLMCRACTLGSGNAPHVLAERKSFSLPQLVNHFENLHLGLQHAEPQGRINMDWTQDMLLLPELPGLGDFKATLGKTGHKFNLVHEAVPWVFDHTREPVRPWPQADGLGDDLRQPDWEEPRYKRQCNPQIRRQRIEDGERVAASRRSHAGSHGDISDMQQFGPAYNLNPEQSTLRLDRRSNLSGDGSSRGQSHNPSFYLAELHTDSNLRRGSQDYSRLNTRLDRAESLRPYGVVEQDSVIQSDGMPIVEERSVCSARRPSNEPNDFNLTAALESHLARERDEPARYQAYQSLSRSRGEVWEEPTHEIDSVLNGEHYRVVESVTFPCHPAPSGEKYRYSVSNDLPLDRFQDDPHRATYSQRTPMRPDLPGHAGVRQSTGSFYTREAPPAPYEISYEEAFEIVHVRDAEGEYVIRRPARHERETSRVSHREDYSVALRRSDYSSLQEAGPIVQPPLLQVRGSRAPPRQAPQDISHYEEYDPRNPAPVSHHGGGRYVGY